jgi:hypothetical protein
MSATRKVYHLDPRNATRDAAALDALCAARPLTPPGRAAACEAIPAPAGRAAAIEAAKLARREPLALCGLGTAA